MLSASILLVNAIRFRIDLALMFDRLDRVTESIFSSLRINGYFFASLSINFVYKGKDRSLFTGFPSGELF